MTISTLEDIRSSGYLKLWMYLWATCSSWFCLSWGMDEMTSRSPSNLNNFASFWRWNYSWGKYSSPSPLPILSNKFLIIIYCWSSFWFYFHVISHKVGGHRTGSKKEQHKRNDEYFHKIKLCGLPYLKKKKDISSFENCGLTCHVAKHHTAIHSLQTPPFHPRWNEGENWKKKKKNNRNCRLR